ncbi:MAG: ATP-grasp enzyme [Drouetiella hepatica Uher 2000/2452]|jgi:predicted ATP-grasp superfamily ATP-dependent carboligase|uniref:ATP-grasp enzyme n=1 Tax=Drouetiella hepatica Uher 2000/2452 TaxID=904376 RepID=A0A951UKW4_9CYAN|nr:ATP-grasp enzyme [Drouetiella hepatica Uher 2000/2452]
MVFNKADNRGLQAPANAVKTVATLALLLLVLPLNLALTAIALLRALVVRPSRKTVANPKTILVSGGKMTKALQLARSFHQAGHRVILIESHKYWLTGHRFSWAVDRFYTVPNPQAKDYADALLAIVQNEGVDVYIPVCSPVASRYDAEAKQTLSAYCEVMHFDPETVQKLDDKYEFSVIAASLGLTVPDSYRITQPQQVTDFDFSKQERKYILKSIPYDSVRRLDLTRLPCETPLKTAAFVKDLPISDRNPWIMQAFIPGQEYCTHSTVRNGELQMHCCCKSSAFQINYERVDKPEIEAWVRQFVGGLNLTGQVSFDFIQAEDGSVYAIECNPRTHSAITMFYNHADVARAYLENGFPVIQPLKSSRPTYWIYHEIWRLVTQPTQIRQRLQIIFSGKDAIFDWSDPLPFLMVHHVQIPWLLIKNLRQLKGWIRIDFNIGKLVEMAGD